MVVIKQDGGFWERKDFRTVKGTAKRTFLEVHRTTGTRSTEVPKVCMYTVYKSGDAPRPAPTAAFLPRPIPTEKRRIQCNSTRLDTLVQLALGASARCCTTFPPGKVYSIQQ